MPRKISAKYHKRFINDIHEYIGRGGTVTSFPAFLFEKYNVTIMRDEIEEWIDIHSDFSRAIEIAEANYLARLERLREIALIDKSKGLNLKSINSTLEARFGKDYSKQYGKNSPRIVTYRAKDAKYATRLPVAFSS